MKIRLSVSALFVVLLVFSMGACKKSPPTTAVAVGADWTMHGRTNDEQRFSPLSQINEQNIGQLGLLWDRELGTTRGLEATPLVSNGVIFTTGEWSVAYALDAKTGETLWSFDPQVPRARVRTICCDVVNRGVALYNDKVYLGTLDGRLIALNAKSGKPVWDVITVDQSKPYSITGAPRIAKGKVLIGNAGSEFGVRGYISAYDAETGKLLWRTFTVPGDPAKGFESKAMEAAAKTWHGQWWIAGGGGCRGTPSSTTLTSIWCTPAPETESPGSAISAAPAVATTCTSLPSWRCARATASWFGTIRLRPEIVGTTTPRNL